MNEEALELAETIGDLFVENRVIELRATLDVIPIETAHRSNDGVDCLLTQAAFIRSRTTHAVAETAQPLNEMNQVIRFDTAPALFFHVAEK